MQSGTARYPTPVPSWLIAASSGRDGKGRTAASPLPRPTLLSFVDRNYLLEFVYVNSAHQGRHGERNES